MKRETLTALRSVYDLLSQPQRVTVLPDGRLELAFVLPEGQFNEISAALRTQIHKGEGII